MLDKLHAFYAKAEQRPLMRPGMHSALLISRLVSITLRKPAPPVVPSQSRISIALDVDGTLSFISSLHLRPAVPLHVSWTAVESRSPPPPLRPPVGTSLPSCPPSRVFYLPLSSLPREPSFLSIAVIRLSLRRRLLSPAPSRSLLHRCFFSVLTPGLGP